MTDRLHDDSGLRGERAADSGAEEERERYRELLEELRTILPGVQVLFAFLLVAPFSQRFVDLDGFGRNVYGIVLTLTGLATALFLAPASYHRIGRRSRRKERLHTAIRLMVVGMLVLAAAMVLAVYTVMRFIFAGSLIAAGVAGGLAGVIALVWYLIPLARRLRE